MKALAPTLLLAAALLAPSAAQADSWRGHHRGRRPPAQRYYRQHGPSYGYGYSYRYSRPYHRSYGYYSAPYRYYHSAPYRYYSAPYYGGPAYGPYSYGAYDYYPAPPPYCPPRRRPRIGFWFGF